MAIIKWEPTDDFEKTFEEWHMPTIKSFMPAVDIYETKDDVVIETPLAGIDPKDIEISIENNVLTLKGESKKESEIDDKNYYRKEIHTGGFFRSVALPNKVIGDDAKAESFDGMLKITIPKAPEAKPKTIKVIPIKSR